MNLFVIQPYKIILFYNVLEPTIFTNKESAMYYKDRQIVNIYIYKYAHTCIRKFRLLFFCGILNTKRYLLASLKQILNWSYIIKNAFINKIQNGE